MRSATVHLRVLVWLLSGIFFLGCVATASGRSGMLLDGVVVGPAIIAVGERGIIVRSVDSGRTWEPVPSPTHATLTGIVFADANIGWIAGHDGVILHTRDGGRSWTQQFSAEQPETSFLDVAALDSLHAIAVGAFGAFYSTADGGQTWEKRKVLDEDMHLNRVTLMPGQSLLIAGEHGTLLRSNHTGSEAGLLAPPYDGSFYGVLRLGDTLLAYGMRGHAFRSEDAGQTWSRVQTGTNGLLVTALRLASGTVIMAGQARVLVVSHDGGQSFSLASTVPAGCVAELLEAPDGSVIALGQEGASRLDAAIFNRHPPPADAKPATP